MSATKTKVLICPYCGDTQPATERCRACGGLFEPLSRQASHNAMGPWYVRDENRPFQPGASYETIVRLIERDLITRYTILRSPTTKQFWTVARRVPGIAHLLGYCHNCDASVGPDDHGCPSCGVPFGAYLDRNYLGLPEVKPLPWEAPVEDDTRGRGGVSATHGRLPSNGSSPVDFRRAAEPLGLSSFASDDELRGMAARPSYVPPGSDSSVAAGSGELATASDAGPASFGSTVPADSRAMTLDSANSVAARSLQRRLQAQQSQIRVLMIVLGVVSILSIVVILAVLFRDAGRSGEAQPNGDAPATLNSKGPESSQQEAPANSNQPSDVQAVPLDDSAPPTSLPAEDINAPAIEPNETIAESFAEAQSLVIEGQKEQRLLKDRIRDVEAAVQMMKSIRDTAPAAEHPAELTKALTEAERLLERLKLQEFFP